MTTSAPSETASLRDLDLDHRFNKSLPEDPDTTVAPRQVFEAVYSHVSPAPTSDPSLIAHSAEVAAMLGIGDAVGTEDFVRLLSGNGTVEGMQPYAVCYGGHQFGNWAGQLGDGRAITLGEIATSLNGHQTLQLKGAGPTPYSRHADGLAVLRSSIREFLCSEAMHHLGVPTTRALSLTLTGDQVMRDMFYDGNAAYEPGAVVCRIAPSFLRFGNYEIFAARKDIDTLRTITDYTIKTHFPALIDDSGDITAQTYVSLFAEVVRLTAVMVVEWMRVGFVHGVMNTDNMSILGLTIDYGPYGWLEDYDPDWTPNTTDRMHRRYRFGNQPGIAHWNLSRLASALHPLVGEVEPLQETLDTFVEAYEAGYGTMMAAKLGLQTYDRTRDRAMIESLLDTLQLTETDMTIFFRRLAHVPAASTDSGFDQLRDAFYPPDAISLETQQAFETWLEVYRLRLIEDGIDDDVRLTNMNAVNPKYVLRNYLAQIAIDAATDGDPTLVSTLLDVLRRPYDEQPESEQYAAKRPEWARTRPGCSMLSCSS